MARDRFSDESEEPYDDEPRRGPDLESAKRKVAFPAVVLILFGLIGLLLAAASLALAILDPTLFGNAYADAFEPMIKNQPPSAQRDEQLKQIGEMRNLRMDSPLNLGSTVVSLVASLLVLVGGVKMKGLNSYGLSMTAAIVSLYPLGTCLCCLMPFGIWALIVLMNADVKAAFRAKAR